MSKSNWLINGACCVLLLWGGFKISRDWKSFAATHQATLLQNPSDRIVVKGPAATAAPVAEAWTDILSRNPFSFDRSDIDIAPAAPAAPRAALPKPVLFGVMDLGKGPVAMLGDPGARSSSQSVKVGEKFKGWTVVKIDKRFVVVENNGVEESVDMGVVLIDREAGKTAVSTSGPTVTSTSPPAPVPVPVVNQAPVSPSAAPGTLINTPFGPQPAKTP
jgi:hypothetical protein